MSVFVASSKKVEDSVIKVLTSNYLDANSTVPWSRARFSRILLDEGSGGLSEPRQVALFRRKSETGNHMSRAISGTEPVEGKADFLFRGQMGCFGHFYGKKMAINPNR